MPLTIWNYVKSYKQSSKFLRKIGFYFSEITWTTEFQGSNVLLPTVKILKFGTPQTIAIIVLKIEKFDVTLH